MCHDAQMMLRHVCVWCSDAAPTCLSYDAQMIYCVMMLRRCSDIYVLWCVDDAPTYICYDAQMMLRYIVLWCLYDVPTYYVMMLRWCSDTYVLWCSDDAPTYWVMIFRWCSDIYSVMMLRWCSDVWCVWCSDAAPTCLCYDAQMMLRHNRQCVYLHILNVAYIHYFIFNTTTLYCSI
jgi:hypothetical protein